MDRRGGVVWLATCIASAQAWAESAPSPAPAPAPQSTPAPAGAPAPAPGSTVKDEKVLSAQTVDTGSDAAKQGKFAGFMGLNQSWLDTRVSDRSPNLWGQTGVMRVNSANPGKAGYFDFGLHGRAFYTAREFLPVVTPFITDCARYDGARSCDHYVNGYMSGSGTFGATVLDGSWLLGGVVPTPGVELSLAGTASANENSESLPRVLVSTGNLGGSAKLSLPIVVWTAGLAERFKLSKPLAWVFPIPLSFGVDGRFYLPTRNSALGPQFDNFQLVPTALATVDFYEVRGWPFRAHLNAGYSFQNTWGVEESIRKPGIADGAGRWLTGAQGHLAAVGLDYNYLDRVMYGAAVEIPLPFATPFLEYTGEVPVPAPWKCVAASAGTGGECSHSFADAKVGGKSAVGPENPFFNPIAWPSRVTPGVRITPGRGLAFDVALDLTVGGRWTIVDGLATQVPWAAWVGVSYAFSPFVAETQVEVREVERRIETVRSVPAVKAGGRIAGRVLDDKTGKPVPDARLWLPGQGPRFLANADGTYESFFMDPGIYDITAEAPDYDSATVKTETFAGRTVTLDIRLKPNPRFASFRATVVNEKDEAVPATIILTDARGVTVTVDAKDGTGSAEIPPGKYNAVAKADGYLLSGKNVVADAGVKTAESFLLKPEPKKRLTTLTREKIEIKSTIPFEFNKARLLTAASFILDEVVDTLLKNPQIGKLRVEGHTDNTGNADYNQKLSQARAEAVRDYLVQNGVASERLEAAGFGDQRPVAPNNSEAGRAKNRRVDFVIVSQDAGEPGAEGGGAPK
ncbi:MAG: OmpA family protein [Deltaproteobacteria bacterium]|nr:OmpA family protein [Deltaproteobacteria bacterium]